MCANNTTIKAEKIHSESLKDISFYVLCISRLCGALFSFPWEQLVYEILETSQRFIKFDFKNEILYTYFVYLSTNFLLSNTLLLLLFIFCLITCCKVSLTKFTIYHLV
jgi:hypothetical protein